MNREKIIQLAQRCGGYYRDGDAGFESMEDIETFYHAAQAEAFEGVIDLILYKQYDDPYILVEKIREMVKEME